MSIDFGTDIYEEPIVAKTFLSEDAQEGSLRPKTLSEYIGQEKAKGNLAVFIAAAKKRGVRFGRPTKEAPPEFDEIVARWQKKEIPLDEILKEYDMSAATFYRRLREFRLSKGHKR